MRKPIKIAFFIKGGHSWIGGREYIENLILTLGELSTQGHYLELYAISEEPLSPNVRRYIKKVYNHRDQLPVNYSKHVKWQNNKVFSTLKNLYFEYFLSKEKMDFVYPYFSENKIPRSYNSAAWIADFQHKYLEEYFSDAELISRDKSYTRLILGARKVILSSNVAQDDCKNYFPESIGKTCVVPFRTVPQLGWYDGDPVETQKKYNLPDKFLLVSNQFWQHKNHLIIFKALQLLKQQSIYPIVVCTGHVYDARSPGYSDKVLRKIHECNISNQVKILGLLPKLDQLQLLRRSIAIIQPSLFEGWSTIVENARCFGKAAILSDIAVHKEQNLPNSKYFECSSAESLAEHIKIYWEELNPGPDKEKEGVAYTDQLILVSEYGESFLKENKLI